MNQQPPESHRDDFSWTEAVLDNSPASPDLNILERSEAHCLSRVLEAAEYEHRTPLELDATDDSVFLPDLDDYGDPSATASTPGCSLLGSDSVFPAMLDSSSCTPATSCTSAEEATFLPWLVPEGNHLNSLLYPEMVLDPSFTAIQGENHHISPEQSHYTTEGSHVGDLINDNWASSPFIPSSDSFALDALLSDRQEWDTILQPTAYPLTMRRGFDNYRTVRLILTFAV
ncbi:Hypothetical protein NCS54_01436700 [Fusarium falciforme]|uniref:Hypothetical protein n=1 Tax=Fusarium falciforme TaxID=195108 RepID=UPI0023013ED0|nr:Hypothetical protein NCS54_01436700 [Fusarium falciforme]WAO96685.1 Hypothetical protein NCS54_01436700 [Fusarium falciforme]